VLQEGLQTRDRDTKQLLRMWSGYKYDDGHFVMHGLERTWYVNGNSKSERSFELGAGVGRWRSWFANGQLRSDYTYSDEPSPMEFRHENGALAAAGQALGGLREGEWSYFFPSGKLRKRGSYRASRATGQWTLWFESGGLKSRGMYVDDRRVGSWEHWKD
jgi:antitoxin component YwqK of YwqJK toxin-antitoxin module